MKSAPLKMTPRLAERCRKLVHQMAEKYQVAPVLITAHVRFRAADLARIEVWRVMVDEMGFTRQAVADMFGRDRRRLRASVLGSLRRSVVPATTAKVAKRKRYTVPFQSVGSQLVWNFGIPIVLERPTAAVDLRQFMKPVPMAVRESADYAARAELARFYEAQAAALRGAQSLLSGST